MKNILLVFLLLGSLNVMAQVVNTGWVYHPAQCVAQTQCPNGQVITCSTVGFNYGNAPRVPNNLCRSRVIPGRLVHCQGYADQVNAFGQLIFVPANYPVSCF